MISMMTPGRAERPDDDYGREHGGDDPPCSGIRRRSVRVMVGGAVLNQEYADMIGADFLRQRRNAVCPTMRRNCLPAEYQFCGCSHLCAYRRIRCGQ